ncbi:MAG TPA: VWA domain-containing protein [Candidatus Limnocylindrales bacterium]|nr:VWA domain-containing protein [Candidatus Limnocylindrales bacterium]
MSFAHPLWLIAGIAVAGVFLWWALVASRRATASALSYSDLAFFESATKQRIDPALLIALACAAALLAFGAALAGPRFVASVPVRGVAIVLCVDTSGSMSATDVSPTRADAAAAAVRAFVDGVPDGTRLGIVAFSSGAGVVQPLTDDKDAVRDVIGRIPPPNGGTAIGDALAAAARALPKSGRRAIVLITDGVNNLGADPQSVAQQIGNDGIEIDTVGIGTNDSGQFVPGTDVAATIDEDALRQLASVAHGAYARANDAGALRAHLAALANSTTAEKKRIDASLPLAFAGGVIVIIAAGAGLLAGRFP